MEGIALIIADTDQKRMFHFEFESVICDRNVGTNGQAYWTKYDSRNSDHLKFFVKGNEHKRL